MNEQLAKALRELHDATYSMIGTSDRFPKASLAAREALREYDRLSYNPGMTVDRLLGLADQFLEDWEDDPPKDPTLLERKAEWDEWRPRIVACVEACVAIAVLEDTEPHSIDSIIGTAQGALK